MDAMDLYTAAKQRMDKWDIAHCQSDLFLRKNSVSVKLMAQLDQRAGVREFVDDIDGDVWFRIHFAYPNTY